MQIDLLSRPGNAAARVVLSPGEQLTTESGAMIAMSDSLELTTSTHKRDSGSLFAAAKRLLAGESLFLNHYSASTASGEVFLAATLPGDMLRYDLRGENLIVQSGSFVACESSVNVNLGWQGFKSFFSGESAFWLQLSGTGPVIISSFGAIYPIEVDGDYIVCHAQSTADNGDIVVAGIPGDEATVKTYTRKGRHVILLPANARLSPMEFDADEVAVFGRVVTVLRRL